MAVCLYFNDFNISFNKPKGNKSNVLMEASHNFLVSSKKLTATCNTKREKQCMKVLKDLVCNSPGGRNGTIGLNASFSIRHGTRNGSSCVDVTLKGGFLKKLKEYENILQICKFRMDLDLDKNGIEIDYKGVTEELKGSQWNFTQDFRGENGLRVGKNYKGNLQIWF